VESSANQSSARFLTFRVDTQLYALRSEEVSEVVRVPALARIPQAPSALLGVANLRGSVLPVSGLRELLGKPPMADMSDARAIVLDIGAPIAVVVDSVETLETVESEQIETRKKELSAADGEKLTGAFPLARDKTVAKILDIKSLLEDAFANRKRADRQARPSQSASIAAPGDADSASNAEMLVTFEVA
jgi:purine-binding chemotaxis protein CheW